MILKYLTNVQESHMRLNRMMFMRDTTYLPVRQYTH